MLKPKDNVLSRVEKLICNCDTADVMLQFNENEVK